MKNQLQYYYSLWSQSIDILGLEEGIINCILLNVGYQLEFFCHSNHDRAWKWRSSNKNLTLFSFAQVMSEGDAKELQT